MTPTMLPPIYNFSAGPAALPSEVVRRIREDLPSWQGQGVSIMEISHRTPEFESLAQSVEATLRDLLNIPDQYHILFMQGGGRAQYAMLPLNLLDNKSTVDYFNTGIWSEIAIAEASRYAHVNIVASNKGDDFKTLPLDSDTYRLDPKAAYVHYVSNETINGIEFYEPPFVQNTPLIADMSSDLLSKPINVNQFSLIYACAQKNLGIAGLTLVIIKDDLLGKAHPLTPTLYNYQTYVDTGSLYNTPPTFAWYVTGLVLEWLKAQGGVEAIYAVNQRKAKKLYDFIDQHPFYRNSVAAACRSRMNVVFHLANPDETSRFLVESRAAGLYALKGHSRLGGLRASLYNSMPEAGVDALITFMSEFAP